MKPGDVRIRLKLEWEWMNERDGPSLRPLPDRMADPLRRVSVRQRYPP